MPYIDVELLIYSVESIVEPLWIELLYLFHALSYGSANLTARLVLLNQHLFFLTKILEQALGVCIRILPLQADEYQSRNRDYILPEFSRELVVQNNQIQKVAACSHKLLILIFFLLL